MSDYLIDGAILTDIADAIREKTGESGVIFPNGFSSAISAIPTGGGGSIATPSNVIVEGNGTVTLEADTLYLFSTIYGGSNFTGADVEAGTTSFIYIVNGYGRSLCIIHTTQTEVTYHRNGEKPDDHRYAKLDLKSDNATPLVAAVGNWKTTSENIDVKSGQVFLFLSEAVASKTKGEFSGATVLCETWCGRTGNDANRWNYCAVVCATSNNVTYSLSGTHRILMFITGATVTLNDN